MRDKEVKEKKQEKEKEKEKEKDVKEKKQEKEKQYQVQTWKVMIICGGKCGSSTLYSTFKHLGYETLHAHNDLYFRETLKYPYSLYDSIDASSKAHSRIYIIDAYRLPIERKISSFFQNIKQLVPNYTSLSVDELISIFNTKPFPPFANKTLLNGCEEYHSMEGILNHYQKPMIPSFDFEKKFIVCTSGKKVFIKLRFQEIQQWGEMLSEIFNKNIKLQPENLTETKSVKALYEDFKLKYWLPKYYLDTVAKDKAFLFYNTPEEQKAYLATWTMRSR